MYHSMSDYRADVGHTSPPGIQQLVYPSVVPQLTEVQMRLPPPSQPQNMVQPARAISPITRSKPCPQTVSRSSPSRAGGSQVERGSAVRLVCPRSNTIVCARYDRTAHTRARVQHGAVVCEDYMYKQHCPEGERCQRVHVAAGHTWNYILPHVDGPLGIFEQGFTVRCFGPDMTEYFNIPSELVYYTNGSMEYIYDYNEFGDNSRKKFVLCEAMINDSVCVAGMSCNHLHAIMDDFSSVVRNSTHVFDEGLLPRYPRLSADVTVRVFEQNSSEVYKDYAGDQVLVTEGARQYLAAFEAEGDVPRKRMQHCAHFRTKRLCRMGDGCNFIHVVQDILPTTDTSPRSASRSDSPACELSVSIRNRSLALRQSGSHVAEMLAEKYGASRDDGKPARRHTSPFVNRPSSEMASPPRDDVGLFQSGVLPPAGGVSYVAKGGCCNAELSPDGVSLPCLAADGGEDQVGQCRQSGEQLHGGGQAITVCSKFRQISPPRRNNPYASPVISSHASPHTREFI